MDAEKDHKMRYLKIRTITPAILTVFLFGSATLAQDGTPNKWEHKVKSGQRLKVDLETGGSVTIKGWDKKIVEVVARPEYSDYEDDLDIEVTKTSYGVKITTSTPFRWSEFGWGGNQPDIDFYIRVPAKFDLELESRGGDFIITGVDGHIDGQTMGGDLELAELAGDIDLGTMGGDITVRDSHLDGRVHTMGGDVELKNVSGAVRGSTMGGDVRYTGKITTKVTEAIRINTMGGDINLDDAPAGAVVKTMGGDITIGTAGGFIHARTMGGDIEIKALDGGVKATTMGGDVEITIVGDASNKDRDIEIVSKGGDVLLIVPKNYSMDIDITIAYNRRASHRVAIDSDVALTIEESDKDNDRWRRRRRYIYGRGKIAGGKHKVKIETVNGRVVIRES